MHLAFSCARRCQCCCHIIEGTILGLRYLRTVFAVSLGHIEINPLLIAQIRVDLVGLKHAACKKLHKSAVAVSCLMTPFATVICC